MKVMFATTSLDQNEVGICGKFIIKIFDFLAWSTDAIDFVIEKIIIAILTISGVVFISFLCLIPLGIGIYWLLPEKFHQTTWQKVKWRGLCFVAWLVAYFFAMLFNYILNLGLF